LNCLHLLTEEEINPGYRGDLKMIDAETSGAAEISISPAVLRRYRARLDALRQDVKGTAHKSMASYYFISTSTPLSEVILRGLRAQGVVS
jgi:hypothetical protein